MAKVFFALVGCQPSRPRTAGTAKALVDKVWDILSLCEESNACRRREESSGLYDPIAPPAEAEVLVTVGEL